MSTPARTVLITRAEQTESHHEIHGIALDASGRVLAAFGDFDQHVFPRSALKPFQALPLVSSGAADHFGLGSESVALACASHSGEEEHVRRVAEWLHDIDLDVDDLGCGAVLPLYPPAVEALLRNGGAPSKAHNNCSGKHTGMLTLCRHLDAPLDSYLDVDHPVQRLIADHIGVAVGLDHLEDPAPDGCGAPTWPVPLSALARAIARFDSDAAGARIFDAVSDQPYLVAGTDRPETLLMRANPDIVAKSGAEGVFVAAIRSRGIGIAIKVADGAQRASGVALIALLDSLGATSPGDQLDVVRNVALLNSLGERVGSVVPGVGWND